MDEKQIHIKHYSADDILKYHQGKLNANEMHALEKAALDDPFLSDALDGFENNEQATTDIIELKIKLSLKQQKNKASVISMKKYYPFIGIAASITIFIFLGVYLSQQNKLNKTTPSDGIVKAQPSLPENNQPEISDTNKAQLAAVELKKANQDYPNIKQNDQISNKSVVEKSVSIDKIKQEENSNSIVAKLKTVEDVAVESDQDNVKIYSTDEVKALTAASAPGNMAMADTKITAMPMQTDFTNVAVESSNNTNIVATKGFSVKKTIPKTNSSTESESDEKNMKTNNEAFQNYVTQNTSACLDEKQNPVHGQIVLTCKINANKKASQIKILQSLYKDCDFQVVELLKTFSEWKATSKQKIKLIIQL